MPWWLETDNVKEGYNKDKDGNVTKYHRITSLNGEDHDHEFYNTKTGVTGYHGENTDRTEYGEAYNDFENNNGKYRK